MGSHRIVARLSPHTSLRNPPQLAEYPPQTTSRGRLPRNSFTPAPAAMHTPSSRHAPTSPLNAATRAHTSGRETARSTAQIPASVGEGEEVGGAMCVLWACK